jgi:hypothetical protein
MPRQSKAGLDTALERVYACHNHGGIQLIDGDQDGRDFGEDERHSEKVGNVSDRCDVT